MALDTGRRRGFAGCWYCIVVARQHSCALDLGVEQNRGFEHGMALLRPRQRRARKPIGALAQIRSQFRSDLVAGNAIARGVTQRLLDRIRGDA